MKKQRYKKVLLIMLLLNIFLIVGCSGEDKKVHNNPKIMVPKVQKNIYVYDQGNFLSDKTEKQTNKFLYKLEEETTIEFAVVTIPSLNDIELEEYAVDLGNILGIGKKDKNNGILLLISRTDTKVRLEIGDGLQEILTDSKSGRVLDQFFVPHRDKDDYNTAVIETVQAVINILASSNEYNFAIDGVDTELVVEEPSVGMILLTGFIIIFAIILILCLLEWITGKIWGDGFGDGIVFAILDACGDSNGISDGSSGGSFGSGFGGGGFSGGGASR